MMKRYKQILYGLGVLLVLASVGLAYWAYESGTKNQRKNKLTAEMLLKDAAVAWGNQALDKLGIQLFSEGDDNEAKSPQRRMVTSEETFIVNVDSVKEKRRLLSSDLLASMVRYLFASGGSSIDELNKQWQEKLNMGLPHYYSALELILRMPNDRKNLQRTVAGDSTLCLPENKLGDYYLDNMYFFEVKAYLSAPSVWWCADWRQTGAVVCIGGIVLGICIIVLILIYNKGRTTNNKKETLPLESVAQADEVLSSDETFSEDDVICFVDNGRYRMREILFDETEMTITFRGQVEDCSKQSYKLFSAFIHAEGHFLSYNRFAEICGWNLDDIGIRNKRKTTVSQLRKLLKSKESRVNILPIQNEKGEDGFKLLIQE